MKVLRWMLTAAAILIITDVAMDAIGLGTPNVADAAGSKEGGTGVPPTPAP